MLPLIGLIILAFLSKYASHISLQVPLSSYVHQQPALAKLRCGFLVGFCFFLGAKYKLYVPLMYFISLELAHVS